MTIILWELAVQLWQFTQTLICMTVMGKSTSWKSKRNTDRCLLGRLEFTAAVPKQLVGGREREQHKLSFSLSFHLSLSLALISSALSLAMMSVYQWLTALLKRNAEHGRFWPCKKKGGRRGKKMRARERERHRECVREREREVSVLGRFCSTSVWSMRGCKIWTWAPGGSMPLCSHLYTLQDTETNAVSHMHVAKKKHILKTHNVFWYSSVFKHVTHFWLKSPTLFLSREQVWC